MAEGGFASACLVEEFILEHENKNTAQKTAWKIFDSEGRRQEN